MNRSFSYLNGVVPLREGSDEAPTVRLGKNDVHPAYIKVATSYFWHSLIDRMMMQHPAGKCEVLWKRYWSIKDEHGCGVYEPILWHLALGGDLAAMVALADTFPEEGRVADRFSRTGLYYRAHKGGCEYAAQHLAMDAFNRGDLASYRYWLRRAARFDPEYLRQLKRFETRLPHQTARERGRGRPYRSYD